MKPTVGLLYSQIGYDRLESKRAIVRAPEERSFVAPSFTILDSTGKIVLTGKATPWGRIWNSFWWTLDFSELRTAGVFSIQVKNGEILFKEGTFQIADALLWNETWDAVALDQAERRELLAVAPEGKTIGWYDAGTPWQEANSHAAFLFGLCDLLEHKQDSLNDEELQRLENQIVTGADYLLYLQSQSQEKGFPEGSLLHQGFYNQKYLRDVVLPSDTAKACAALGRVIATLSSKWDNKKRRYWQASNQGVRWLKNGARYSTLPFWGFPHQLPNDFKIPECIPTSDLFMLLGALVDLHDSAAFEIANQIVHRQFTQFSAQEGWYGHFRQFESGSESEKRWTHGVGKEGYGFNNGQTLGHFLFPLVRLLQNNPDHKDASLWKRSLHDYAYHFFLPSCHRNPFLIAPNGFYSGEGLLWFSGLWHGCTATYGIAAALAFEFETLFKDSRFREIAIGNLQWIAGLNSGVTRESLIGCYFWKSDIPEGEALPASLIHQVGTRTAGSWLNIRGSICNGFSAGKQFTWDVEPRAINDEPSSFTDEDWITHSGGYLMGLARL